MNHRGNKFHLGEEIYVQLSANPQVEEDLFVCKGIIIRLPIHNRQLYKVAVTSVANLSLTAGHRPDIAKKLVGKKVPRHQKKIMKTLASWMEQKLDSRGWITLKPSQLTTLKNSMRRNNYGK